MGESRNPLLEGAVHVFNFYYNNIKFVYKYSSKVNADASKIKFKICTCTVLNTADVITSSAFRCCLA